MINRLVMNQTDDLKSYLKIGQLAKKTGLAVGTLRYYSDLELLQPIYIGDNGYRYYQQNSKQQVEFIKKAQKLGFSLSEIKQILTIRDRGEQPCGLVKSILDQKIVEINTKIEEMTLFRLELENYRLAWIDQPDSQPASESPCPLISSVSLPNAQVESK